MPTQPNANDWWHSILTGNNPILPLRQFRHVWALLPSGIRCKFCNAPYEGPFAPVMRLIGKGPSTLTPRLCRQCEDYASRLIGGTEIEISLLFADVRGSTALAEKMSPLAFSQILRRFYGVATQVLVQSNAWVDKLVGDEVIGIYVPGFAGPHHARAAVEAAQQLLRATGHAEAGGAWLPVGVGVHTGVAFVGSVGAEGNLTDITALGDNVNITARLASQAKAGEILISDAAYAAAALALGPLEQRQLDLKGKSMAVGVHVAQVKP